MPRPRNLNGTTDAPEGSSASCGHRAVNQARGFSRVIRSRKATVGERANIDHTSLAIFGSGNGCGRCDSPKRIRRGAEVEAVAANVLSFNATDRSGRRVGRTLAALALALFSSTLFAQMKV